MLKKVKFSKHLLIVTFLFVFTACGQAATPQAQGESGVYEQEESGLIASEITQDAMEVVFAQWADPPSLDPHGSNDTVSSEAQSQIFEGLTTFDVNGNVVGLLATDFNLVEDNVWEFTLRQGVTFHDGEPFNAEAVALTINRLLAPEHAFPRAFILEMVDEVIVIDEYTVQFVTPFPFSPLPSHLAHDAGHIISPAAIAREVEGGVTVNELPVGTGPFMFYSRIHGEELVMVRNENYWGYPAYIQTLRFVVIPESGTRLNMLMTGEAHATIASAIDAQVIRDTPHLDLMHIYSTRQNYVGFNTQVAPFDDVRVRQAIAMVLDLDAIVYSIDGMGIPAVGPLSPSVTGTAFDQVIPISGTTEEAMELLAEAGFPNGFSTTITLGAGRPAEESFTAQILQINLASIGIDATINEMEWGAFLDYTGAGQQEIFILGWTVVTGDADYGFYPLFHSSHFGIPGNRTFYHNPLVDELLDLARMTSDQEERNTLYLQVTEIIVNEVPKISTFYPTFAFGTNSLEGLFVDFNNVPFFHTARLVE